jgi:hypothetical protein
LEALERSRNLPDGITDHPRAFKFALQLVFQMLSSAHPPLA